MKAWDLTPIFHFYCPKIPVFPLEDQWLGGCHGDKRQVLRKGGWRAEQDLGVLRPWTERSSQSGRGKGRREKERLHHTV